MEVTNPQNGADDNNILSGESMSRFIVSTILAATLAGGGVALAPTTAEAFCCTAVYAINLSPASPPVSPRLTGRVEVNECLGLSFLHIVVNANVPDGTQVIATFPGRQPLMSDWITIKKGRGEYLWQAVTTAGVPKGGLAGRQIVIMDSNFTPLAQGTF